MLDAELVVAADRSARRLMVVLHGLGDSREGYRWLPEAMAAPWLSYLLVNAPDEYYGGYSWYDFMGQTTAGVERSRGLLFALLDAQRAGGWPTAQTLLFGFSQGALMAWEVGLRYPHRLAGLIGISGYVHQPEQALRELSPVAQQQRFLATHGRYDPLIPFDPVRAQIELLQDHGFQIEWHAYAKDHTIAGEEELDVVRRFVRSCFGEGAS